MRTAKSDWTDLFLAFRLSLDPRKLWLALRGVVLSLILLTVLLGVLAAVYHGRGVRFVVEKAPRAAGRRAREVCRRQATHVVAERPAAESWRLVDTDVWGAVRRGQLGRAVRATGHFAAALVRSARMEVRECTGLRVGRRDALLRMLWLSESVSDLLLVAMMCGFVLLLVWSYYGGAIMRVAAVEYALGQRIELASAAAYVWRKHQSFYGAPLGLAVAMLVLGLCIGAVGLVAWNILVLLLAVVGLAAAGVVASVTRDRARSTWAGLGAGLVTLAVTFLVCWFVAVREWRIPVLGELILVLFSPLMYLAGLVIALFGVWLVFGTPLMAGALSSRDGDVFEAWSRSFHYLFLHPWPYAFYLAAAAAHGAACLGFVWLVRVATEWATLLPLSVGLVGRFESVYHYMVMDPAAVGGAAGDWVLAVILALARLLLDLLVVSFVVAYACTAATIVYFLLRRRADGTPISEVHLEPRDRELLQPPPAQPA